MRNTVEIENIDEMRRQAGVDDVELRDEIRGLHAGDTVKVTLRSATHPATAETLPVRITFARGGAFRGELARRPASASLAVLQAGSPLTFTASHIHSILKRRSAHERRLPVPRPPARPRD
jgi:hypothetical protein